MRTLARIASLALLLAFGPQAFANPCPPGNPPTNCAPPSGPVILDLSTQAVPHGYQQYTASFVAGVTTTQISFAFREDPAFLELDNVSVTTGGGPNLLTNGNFEGGGGSVPTGWTALNAFGAAAAGRLRSGCGVGGSACWYDGSVQGYDGLNQSITTAIGTSYDVTFSLNDNGGLTTFRPLSANGDTGGPGGDGIDLLLYAGAAIPTEGPTSHEGPPPTGVPEPATLALFAAGLAGLGFSRRRRARA
jgi:hypothetical protein